MSQRVRSTRRRRLRSPPPLTVDKILAWADKFFARHGRWPGAKSGRIREPGARTWGAIDEALRNRRRGLTVRSTLARLLEEHRGARKCPERSPLTVAQILAWADAYQARHGRWPKANSGRIAAGGRGTWCGLDSALRQQSRGLTDRSSLAQLLQEHRGVRNLLAPPRLMVGDILRWGDAYQAAAGRWPDERSGPIPDSGGESWRTIELALRAGKRGLRRSSLAQLFARHRGRRNHMALRPLTIGRILHWADAHRRRTGRWPKVDSGPVGGAAGETWRAVNAALGLGLRGLPGGSSLTKLLMERRGLRSCGYRPPLTVGQILAWADAYQARHGRWPARRAGTIPESDGDTWIAVEMALRKGSRGLPAGGTLRELLVRERGAQILQRCRRPAVV